MAFISALLRWASASTATLHPLALVDGDIENTTVVTDPGCVRERGLDITRPILAVIDGAKALRAAVTRVFDYPVIARCQLRKLRNVTDRLPDHLATTVGKRMRQAYRADTALEAGAQFETLAQVLRRTTLVRLPRCLKAWLREGLAETPTMLRLGVPTHPGPHSAQHQRHRVDGQHRPPPQPQHRKLAIRRQGTALVRRRHGRSQQTVPPRARTPTPRPLSTTMSPPKPAMSSSE